MTRRPFLAVATAVACALAIAGPAAAQRFTEHHTISVHTEAIWPGELVAFGGLYWGTAYGVCPAGPIHITFEQARRPDRSLGQVPATSVIPWERRVQRAAAAARRCTPRPRHAALRAARARGLVLRAVHGLASAGRARLRGAGAAPTSGRSLHAGQREPARPPSDPTLEIVRPPGPPYQPGGAVRVVGHDYPDPVSDTYCPPKQSRFVQLISYYLTDASGSAWRLDAGEVERDGDIAATIGLPSWRSAPGRASLSAVPIGYEGDPVCGRPGTTTFNITVPRPTLTFTTAPAAGASVTLSGTSWRTDRCDSRVDVVLDRRGAKRVLKRVRPGRLGAFKVTVKVPRGKGANRILAVQRRALEVADPLGRPQRARAASAARGRPRPSA